MSEFTEYSEKIELRTELHRKTYAGGMAKLEQSLIEQFLLKDIMQSESNSLATRISKSQDLCDDPHSFYNPCVMSPIAEDILTGLNSHNDSMTKLQSSYAETAARVI